ncbi:helix-turn-helix domain-containing protein [Enterococcus innesii]|uniref:helix-turn-helix domain-containing protein n=1 Tax=Enterococcus innesii TaxID=2839759 RepID=UPI002DB8CA92|nr:helix-turn-helix transcriptional regulator [Enterococcus innesii]MEB5950648.1 helix-turn-helix domain-containing protein [Enterococcus innesii]
MSVFDRIKQLSSDQGKSMSKVATELGFSENLFYRWKTSEPKAKDLAKVADYFGVTTDYLLGRNDSLSPKGRAIGRGFDRLDDKQQSLFEQLLLQMQEDHEDDD